MKTIRVIKLGTRCIDKATKLEGTLTHWFYEFDGHIEYVFQPRGLDSEGQPINAICITPERFENISPDDYETVKVPAEILGTEVTEKASGFKGMAISFIRHINGCFHVTIQPEGLNSQRNGPVKHYDFDLRSCEGEKITTLSEEKLKESKEKTPSPMKINCQSHGYPV